MPDSGSLPNDERMAAVRANPNDSLRPSSPTSFVTAGSQVTVTIGRNVDSTPLSDYSWQDFQASVQDRLSALLHPSATFGPFTGRGEWEGVAEESAVLILITQYTTDRRNVDAILSTLADEYGQDAIAWSYGPNQLALRPVRDVVASGVPDYASF